MHLCIGSGGQDCGGLNQDRSKSAHLRHLEACASPQGLHLSERAQLFMPASGPGCRTTTFDESNLVPLTLSFGPAPATPTNSHSVPKGDVGQSYRFHRWLKGGENFLTR